MKKEDAVVLGDAGQAAGLFFGLGDDPLEELAPVAVLQDPHAAAGDVPEVLLRLAQHRFGEHGGAGVEVVNARHGSSEFRVQSAGVQSFCTLHPALYRWSVGVMSTLITLALPVRISSRAESVGLPETWIRAQAACAPW